MSYTMNEARNVSGNEYAEFGKPYSAFPSDPDPVDKCLPGSWLNNPATTQLSMCKPYLAQRCAGNWDDACDLYLASLQDLDSIRDFLNATASKKYCRLADGSNCGTRCEPFDPIAQESPSICTYIGNETLKDSTATVDIGMYKPVNISPDYLSRCNQTCDNIQGITDTDPVVNHCLSTGLCGQTMANVCSVAAANGTPINNTALATLCQALAAKATPSPTPVKTSMSLKATNPYAGIPAANGISRVTKVCIFLLLIALIVLVYYTYFHGKTKYSRR